MCTSLSCSGHLCHVFVLLGSQFVSLLLKFFSLCHRIKEIVQVSGSTERGMYWVPLAPSPLLVRTGCWSTLACSGRRLCCQEEGL